MTEPARLALPEGMPVLTDEELASLPQELQDQYLAAVAAELQEVKLTEPQLRAHELGLKVDEVCYGGAAGGGKSHLAIWHADWCSRQFPMHRSLCLRSTMPELRRTLMAKAFELIDTDAAPGVVWRAADKEYRYGNGSVIEFGYCETMDDTRQFLSAEYDLIIIDESTDLGHEQIEMLRSRLRTTKHKRELGVNPHLMLLTNPGGVSHTWHKERFVDQTAAGEYVAVIDDRDALGRGKDRQVAFIPAKVGDNPFIDPDYVSNLVAISDPVRRAQYLDGDWDVFSDQYFSEFNRDIHVVDPFPIPPEWPRYGGYDWGYGAPAALLLAAVDNDRVVHVFREMYGAGMTAAAQAKEFRAWGEKVDFIAADPSIWRNTGVGVPISSQLLEAGLSPLRRAANERVDGWNRVREYLAVDPILGRPRVVIHSNCENLIRTLPLMRRDKNKPEDLNTRSDDHACFPAGTVVQSDQGVMPIEQVVSGDRLLDGCGEWGEVEFAGMSSPSEPIVDVVLLDRGTVRCTPDHPFLVEGRGWVRADALRSSDTIAAWHVPSPLYLRASPTVDTPSRNGGATAVTSGRLATVDVRHFTERSTSAITGRSPKAGMSTMSTEMQATTIRPTWKLSVPTNTGTVTLPAPSPTTSLPIWQRFARWLRSGIEAMRGGRGTPNMASKLGTDESRWLESALSVESGLRIGLAVEGSSARTTASPLPAAHQAWMTRLGSVPAVAASSWSAGMPVRPVAVRVRVLGVFAARQPEPVYAIKMRGESSFTLGNGVIVKNCDAFRYLLMTRPRVPRSVQQEPSNYDERVQAYIHRKAGTKRRLVHDVLGRI